MKVLQINAIVGDKSTGRSTLELAEGLFDLKIENYIAYSTGGCSYPKSFKIGTILDKKVHALLSRIFGLQGYFSKGATRKLIQFLEKIRPDIVHLHNLHSNFVNLNILLDYLAEKDIATVIHLHDCWFYTGRCFHYTLNNCIQWKNKCRKCPPNTPSNESWFFDRSEKMWIDKKAHFERIGKLGVVGISDWITIEAKKSFLSNAKIVRRIYNWINFDIFRPTETKVLRHKLQLDDKFIILGVASAWSNSKGLGSFMKLSRILPDDMVIILAGTISKNVQIPFNVIHFKETNNISELVEIYSLADVFLNLSLEETFGKVTAEALACGTPAIAINSTANPELIGAGCGYVADAENINEILNYILQVKKTGKEKYTDNCIKFAQRNFNMKDRIQDVMNLYIELINA